VGCTLPRPKWSESPRVRVADAPSSSRSEGRAGVLATPARRVEAGAWPRQETGRTGRRRLRARLSLRPRRRAVRRATSGRTLDQLRHLHAYPPRRAERLAAAANGQERRLPWARSEDLGGPPWMRVSVRTTLDSSRLWCDAAQGVENAISLHRRRDGWDGTGTAGHARLGSSAPCSSSALCRPCARTPSPAPRVLEDNHDDV
jgi:hypothetical protein